MSSIKLHQISIENDFENLIPKYHVDFRETIDASYVCF